MENVRELVLERLKIDGEKCSVCGKTAKLRVLAKDVSAPMTLENSYVVCAGCVNFNIRNHTIQMMINTATYEHDRVQKLVKLHQEIVTGTDTIVSWLAKQMFHAFNIPDSHYSALSRLLASWTITLDLVEVERAVDIAILKLPPDAGLGAVAYVNGILKNVAKQWKQDAQDGQTHTT